MRLLVERQNLLRRLKVAEIATQVEQVIKVQSKVLGVTEGLPNQSAARREALNLSALEDQRDVHALFDRLREALGEASRETGPLGGEAAAGLKPIDERAVAAELAAAETRLQGAAFAEAASHQRAVINKLQTLLAQIQEAEGMKEPSQSELADRIRELAKRQEQLRETTERADLSRPDADKLVGQQTDIRKQIAALQESLAGRPEVQRPLLAAQQSADDAAGNLFDQKKPKAVAKQDEVIRKLGEAADEAEREDAADLANLTADQLAERIADLEKAVEELRKADQRQQEASAAAENDPAAAGQQEKQVDQHLVNAEKPQHLPANVRGRVDDARQAVKNAEDNISRDEERQPSVQKANEAVERALSEALTTLADARREQLSAKINELAAAADALDEAEKSERGVARDSDEAARHKGLSAEQAGEMTQQQQEVGEVTGNVAEAIKHTAERATQMLHEADKPIAEAGKQLDNAKHKPGEPSKPAARQAAQEAKQAAEKIAAAAKEIRRELQEAADALEKLARQQFDEVDQGRKEVEGELAQSLQDDADMNQEADDAGHLARHTVPLDGNATTALRKAQHAGAEEDMQDDLSEAAGSLAAREQEIAQALAKARRGRTARSRMPRWPPVRNRMQCRPTARTANRRAAASCPQVRRPTTMRKAKPRRGKRPCRSRGWPNCRPSCARRSATTPSSVPRAVTRSVCRSTFKTWNDVTINRAHTREKP